MVPPLPLVTRLSCLQALSPQQTLFLQYSCSAHPGILFSAHCVPEITGLDQVLQSDGQDTSFHLRMACSVTYKAEMKAAEEMGGWRVSSMVKSTVTEDQETHSHLQLQFQI